MKKIFISIFLILCSTSASAFVEMKIFTNEGYVAFTVEDDWLVLSMQPKLPIAAAIFQIPNPADSGTPDSTSLSLILFQNNSEKGRTAFEAPIKRFGENEILTAIVEEWEVFRQTAKRENVVYTIIEARRKNVADVSVGVRISWPHLKGNSEDYNTKMENTFFNFLKLIRGHLGEYKPKEGEVIRVPKN